MFGDGPIPLGGRRFDRLPFCPHANHCFPDLAQAPWRLRASAPLRSFQPRCAGGTPAPQFPLRVHCVFVVVTWVGGWASYLASCILVGGRGSSCLGGSIRIPRALKDPPTTGQPEGTWAGGGIPNSDPRQSA
jgi:hypothetical protein